MPTLATQQRKQQQRLSGLTPTTSSVRPSSPSPQSGIVNFLRSPPPAYDDIFREKVQQSPSNFRFRPAAAHSKPSPQFRSGYKPKAQGITSPLQSHPLPGPKSFFHDPTRSSASPESSSPPRPMSSFATAAAEKARMQSPKIEPLGRLADEDDLNSHFSHAQEVHPTSVHSPSEDPLSAFSKFDEESEAIYEAIKRGRRRATEADSREAPAAARDYTRPASSPPLSRGQGTPFPNMHDDFLAIPSRNGGVSNNPPSTDPDPLLSYIRNRRLSDIDNYLSSSQRAQDLAAELAKQQEIHDELMLAQTWRQKREAAEREVEGLQRRLRKMEREELELARKTLRQVEGRQGRVEAGPSRDFGTELEGRGGWKEFEEELRAEQEILDEVGSLSEEQFRRLQRELGSSALTDAGTHQPFNPAFSQQAGGYHQGHSTGQSLYAGFLGGTTYRPAGYAAPGYGHQPRDAMLRTERYL